MNEPTQLLYTSVAKPGLDEAELAREIEQSISWSRASGVAGAVLLHGGRLLQVLEGPAHAVQGCFRRLSADARHEQVTLLQTGPLQQPRFERGRIRLAHVHPGFAGSVSEVVAQLLLRPDAVNVETALRLLRNLAPAG